MRTPTGISKNGQRNGSQARLLRAQPLLLLCTVNPPSLVVDFVIDFHVPASVASRYRAHLVSVTRSEAQVRFLFPPGVFRSIRNDSCAAEISLRIGRSVVRASGLCRMDGGSGAMGARVRFSEPVALHDYALLRRACGVEPAADEAPAAPPLDLASQTA